MRVLLVSAHYPPNFVSGGTLQPARIGRGLADRGHEVSVYAGRLDDAAPALTTFETIEDGLPVHWIATSHFISWSDDRNWDNPDVTADFARVLRETDPDVVHVHSLQGLGVGVVREAITHRARVVVTMHDFWWFCARTFLVDRAHRPCSLVVDCGDCPCELGRGWLDRRTRHLRAVLDGVDLVLAPSETAANVLAANGVPVHRLQVDENGVDVLDGLPAPARTAPGVEGGPVRFLYTGGENPLKGAAVLPEVVDRLRSVPGWRLAAHGLPPGVTDRLAGAPVDLRPPFAPDERDAILDGADVLLLPSLMRESHSLVTREALQRGLPVVCTDSLGPEEVVVHGQNGLVVPAASPDVLVESMAGAMRALVDDPGLLADLRRGAAAGVALRPLDDQVDGLVRAYGSVEAGAAASAEPTRVRHVCFVVGIEGAPLRYRALLPAEALALVGVTSDVRWYRDPDVVTTALAADAVVLYRVPATVEVLDLVDRVRERGRPVLFDVDDLIFDPDLADEIPALSLLPDDEAALWLDGVRRYRTTLEASDVFIGSTDGLVTHAAAVVPGLRTERFDNGVGLLGARMAEQALHRGRRGGPLRIGYLSGTTTHDHDWRSVAPAVAEVLAGHPRVELWLGGWVPEAEELASFADRTRRFGFVPWSRLPRLLACLDVNLAPLEVESRFNQAKSAIKWLEAALVATPTVASPTQPFREAMAAGGARPGETGLLAEGLDEWVAALGGLLDDPARRTLVGERARRAALLGWSPHLQARRYQALLERAAASAVGAAARRETTWVPVAPSEPSEPFAHPFPPEGAVEVPWRRRVARARLVTSARSEWVVRRARGLEARAADLVAAEGLGGPIRGAARVVRRSLGR